VAREPGRVRRRLRFDVAAASLLGFGDGRAGVVDRVYSTFSTPKRRPAQIVLVRARSFTTQSVRGACGLKRNVPVVQFCSNQRVLFRLASTE
jgi:hypothetical protein